jgi:hypothetical protein
MIKQSMLTLILPLEEWLFQWIAKGGEGILLTPYPLCNVLAELMAIWMSLLNYRFSILQCCIVEHMIMEAFA